MSREEILSALANLLQEIEEIKTVVRSYKDVDLREYAQTDLPMIQIKEPAESVDAELTSMRQVVYLDTVLKVYFLEWAVEPSTSYAALMKAIRDAIGNNFTLGNTALGCWVVQVSSLSGTFPVYSFEIVLRTKYYLDMKNT